jgi:hypothetical protein
MDQICKQLSYFDTIFQKGLKTMFGSSLPPVGCRRAHVSFMLFVFVCT